MNSLLLAEKGRLLRNADTRRTVTFARCSHTGHLWKMICYILIISKIAPGDSEVANKLTSVTVFATGGDSCF